MERKKVIPIKPIVFSFLALLFASLLFLKPYLPQAIWLGPPSLEQYKKIPYRLIPKSTNPLPWVSNIDSSIEIPLSLNSRLKELDTTALLVIHQGKVVFEDYQNGGGQQVLSPSFSMAKSIVSLLVGIAIEQGKIKSLDQPVGDFIPEWASRTEGKWTFRQVLQMATGSNWNESYWNPFAISAEAFYGQDVVRTTLRQYQQIPPGTQFRYQSGVTQVAGLALIRATQMTLSDFAAQYLWGPLGAEQSAQWSLDHDQGFERAFCCFQATARDFARIGQLVLQDGKWNRDSIVPEAFISEMLKPNRIPRSNGEPMTNYGLHWWLEHTEHGIIPYARGILGQYIIVIPQNETVIVRLGKSRGDRVGQTFDEVKGLMEWGLNLFPLKKI